MWWWGRANKRYVSQADEFLTSLRDRLEEQSSQRQERERGEYIAKLRDHAERTAADSFWSEF